MFLVKPRILLTKERLLERVVGTDLRLVFRREYEFIIKAKFN